MTSPFRSRAARASRPLWLSGASLLLAAGLSSGAPVEPARADAAGNSLAPSALEDLLACTRTDRWIEALELERALVRELDHKLGHVRRDLVLPVQRVIAQALGPRALSTRFRAIVAARSEPRQLARVVTFYRTELGQKYARVHQQVRVSDERAWLVEHPLTPRRRALLEHWVDASRALDRYAVSVVVPATMLERALHAFDASLGNRSERELSAPMRSLEVRLSVVEHSARTLVELSDVELEALTRFESSPDARAYRSVELDAFQQALEEGFAALTGELEDAGERLNALR